MLQVNRMNTMIKEIQIKASVAFPIPSSEAYMYAYKFTGITLLISSASEKSSNYLIINFLCVIQLHKKTVALLNPLCYLTDFIISLRELICFYFVIHSHTEVKLNLGLEVFSYGTFMDYWPNF